MKYTSPITHALLIMGVIMLSIPPAGILLLAAAFAVWLVQRQNYRDDYDRRLKQALEKLDREQMAAGAALYRMSR